MNHNTTFNERLSDWAYAAGWKAVRALPESAARSLFDSGASYAARKLTPESQLTRNLARVLDVAPANVPESVLEASMRSYARYWREAFRLPTMDHTRVVREMDARITGKDNLHDALALGKGVIVALPHSANWDLGGLWLAQSHGGFATVAERLKPESLYRRFLEYREGLGFTVFPLTGEPHGPFAELTNYLADGGIVCLMGERDLRRTGVEVEFFGHTTRLPAGAAKLAQATGAPLLYPEFYYSSDTAMAIRIHPALDTSGTVAEVTQRLATAFEGGIARHPVDWHMLQPQWLDDIDPNWRAAIEGNR